MAPTMVTTPQVRQPAPLNRPNTPERWQAALRRAHEDGVTVRQLAGSGGWIATSTTHAHVAYEVTPWECECQAGEFGDPICKHRSALRFVLGWLDFDPEPEPTPLAVVVRAAEEPCANCQGYGWGYGTVGSGRMDRVSCWVCGGTGIEPATLAA